MNGKAARPTISDVAKAAKTIHHLDWFQVVETRGHIVGGKVAHYQVVLKIGFRLDE